MPGQPQIISLDYPYEPVARYGYGKPPHGLLHDLIKRNHAQYRELLESFLPFKEEIRKIPLTLADKYAPDPCWDNVQFTGRDAVSLYALLAQKKPARCWEIGSGFSTRWIHRAVADRNLATEIQVFDPSPRVPLTNLNLRHIKEKPERLDPAVFGELQAGDLLFLDGTHRVFPNSDVTVFFLDLLFRLRPGVLVHFHDIFLPYDYPVELLPKFYSEQYLLGIYLLGNTNRMEVLLPNAYTLQDPSLAPIIGRMVLPLSRAGDLTSASSFWVEMK